MFVRKFVYDGEDILFEMNDQNDLLASYTHSKIRSDDVLSMDRMGVSYFYLKDHLGSVHEILNSSGNLVQKYVYSAFGKILKTEDSSGQILSSPIVENFYTFTGRESDFETGLNYYRARYYDPGVGRFLTVDPDAGRINTPLSVVNKYAYSINNPVNLTDSTGRSIFDDLGKWGSVALGSFLLGPLGQWGAVNFSGQFSQKDINIVNTVTFGAGSFGLAGPVAFGIATAGATGSALATDGNFVDNFFEAAPMSYASSIIFNGNYYTDGSFANFIIPQVGRGVGAYFAFDLVKKNRETIERRYKRNQDLYNVLGACKVSGLCL